MLPSRTAVLLASCSLLVLAPQAGAAPASPAAAASFVLGDRQVELVAEHGDAGDVLQVRVQECLRRACSAPVTQRITLRAGQLQVGTDTARLNAVIDRRAVTVTWRLAGTGGAVRDGHLDSGGVSDRTSGGYFAGQTAEARVTVDGSVCLADGALGTMVSFETEPSGDVADLGSGALDCR